MTNSTVPLRATAQAERVLQQYTLGFSSVRFIQHNAGIVFRVDADDGPFMLKLYRRNCYELGVTLYHIFYQEPTMRQALLEGYTEIRALPNDHIQILEAMIAYAALDSLAWNSTITTQLDAPLFRRNVGQFVDGFCTSLVADRPFLLATDHS